MKRSKKNRSTNNSPLGSQRKSYQPSSVRGLITSRQQSMRTGTQSEVSQYTQRTQKTNSIASSQDFQYVDDDLEKEEMREVFVSEEEEKVIQKILEVARKGKINKKNAFQIPLKVLQNENFSLNQTKFWKFASELLGASINIYQKRIQNTWIDTNLIHDKLARMAVGKQKFNNEDENEDNLLKPETNQFLMLSIEEFRDSKILDNVDLGEETLDKTDKINISKFKMQFADDPLFQRKLKAFDNTSLKGLLLNVFDVSSSCEVQLFCNENKLKIKDREQMIQKQAIIVPNQLNKIKEQAEIQKYRDIGFSVFGQIQQFKKNNTAPTKNEKQQQGRQDSVGFAKEQNGITSQPLYQQIDDFFTGSMHGFDNLQSQMPLEEIHFQNNQNDNETDYKNQESSHTDFQFHSQPQMEFSNRKQDFSPSSSFLIDGPFSENLIDRSFHSVLTPWEIEFKDGKIRKKTTKRGSKKQNKSKQKIEPELIQFDALKVQNKNVTLKIDKSKKEKNSKKKKSNHKNLLPPQLSIYQKISFKKYSQNVSTRTTFQTGPVQAIKKQVQELPDFLAPDPSMMEIQEDFHYDRTETKQIANIPEQQLFGSQGIIIFNSHSKHPVSNQKYNNIRETKRSIFQKAKQERQLRLSDIYIDGLSPASILITFLHIANEKNMIVRNTPEEDDVILSWE